MIEGCWTKGFDPSGAKVFGSKLKDTKGMIGATDAAALFRSFGIKYFVSFSFSFGWKLLSSSDLFFRASEWT